MPLDVCETGTELGLRLLRLLVDRREGSLLLPLTDDRRSGITTTGTPPLFHTSRRALRLDSELQVAVEIWLSRAVPPVLGGSAF